MRGFVLEKGVRLALSPSLAAVLVDTHYDVMVAGRPRVELAPWILQPGLAVEASWH